MQQHLQEWRIEALTNIAASAIEDISLIKLSANWMAASGSDHEDQNYMQL